MIELLVVKKLVGVFALGSWLYLKIELAGKSVECKGRVDA